MLEQISVYTENKRGAARGVLGLLAGEGINVLSLVNADSGEFGTMRLILSDPARGFALLKENGYLCKRDQVIAAELDDVPGSLETFLAIIDSMNVNIDYLYVGYMRETRTPVIILHCGDRDIVASAIQRKGYAIY